MHFDPVLLIDDDPIYNLLHERILHHTTMVATMKSFDSGKNALAYMADFFSHRGRLPGLILLDLDMPVMDGFQFIDAFYTTGLPGVRDVPIIMVTSSDHPHDRAKAVRYGINYYLTKPVGIDTMVATLNKVRAELG